VGEKKVPEMVTTELHFKAVLGGAIGTCHHSCIVDKDVEAIICLNELCCKATDADEISQVKLDERGIVGIQIFESYLGLVLVAAGKDDGGVLFE